jgi:hypothetical protein
MSSLVEFWGAGQSQENSHFHWSSFRGAGQAKPNDRKWPNQVDNTKDRPIPCILPALVVLYTIFMLGLKI